MASAIVLLSCLVLFAAAASGHEFSCRVCDNHLMCDEKPMHCWPGNNCTTMEEDYCNEQMSMLTCDKIGKFMLSPTRYYTCTYDSTLNRMAKSIVACPVNTTYSEKAMNCLTDHQLVIQDILLSLYDPLNPFFCSYSGVFPDVYNCSRYYICGQYDIIGEEYICPDGQFFNVNAQSCGTYIPPSCAKIMNVEKKKSLTKANVFYHNLLRIADILAENDGDMDMDQAWENMHKKVNTTGRR